MKFLDIFSKLSILLILVILIVGVTKLGNFEKHESKFYEYNNMKINLAQVKVIRARVDYIITYKEDDNMNIFRKYSTSLNAGEIDNIKGFLSLSQKSEFYNVEVETYMLFDKKKVVLYHSPHFLKHATTYSVNENLLSQLRAYGLDSFQYKNLEKIKDVVYNDVNKFFDDVISYAKLKKSNWSEKNIPKLGLGSNANKFMQNVDMSLPQKSLSDEDIKTIVLKMQESYKVYDGIK